MNMYYVVIRYNRELEQFIVIYHLYVWTLEVGLGTSHPLRTKIGTESARSVTCSFSDLSLCLVCVLLLVSRPLS